ncbi:MAG: ABC transporter ATP-binding protein [Planctomycetes bacterium]|nr:ABC transporter ATP-binding protein [Planctomycetota bacterium]
MTTPALQVHELTKSFSGGVIALDDVDLSIPAGSLFGLLGPNGAGKTTLFSLAAGFLKPTMGRLEVLGTDVARISELRGRFAMLPQDAALQKDVPVIDQLIMFCRLNGLAYQSARAAAQEALEFVGLGDVGGRTAGALSHGMAKRVAVSQTVLGNPEVVFLDEPTAGLDPDNARSLRELIRRMRGEGRTVILSSHNLQEVQDLCDEVAILHHGRVVEQGSMAELTGTGSLLRVKLARPLTDAAGHALASRPTIAEIETSGETEFNVRFVEPAPGGLDAAMGDLYTTLGEHGLWPRQVLEGASLESRFLQITGGTFDGASST